MIDNMDELTNELVQIVRDVVVTRAEIEEPHHDNHKAGAIPKTEETPEHNLPDATAVPECSAESLPMESHMVSDRPSDVHQKKHTKSGPRRMNTRMGRAQQKRRAVDEADPIHAMQLSLVPSNASLSCIRFRWKRRRMMSIPDIGLTAQTLITMLPNMDRDTLIPHIIQNIPSMELSIFHILQTELRQPFSLNNGMVIQEALYYWLVNYRCTFVDDAKKVCTLYRVRESTLVWWEGRAVRIWHWPFEMRIPFVQMCHCVLNSIVNTAHEQFPMVESCPESAVSSSSSPALMSSAAPCVTPHMYRDLTEPLCVRCTSRAIAATCVDFWPISLGNRDNGVGHRSTSVTTISEPPSPVSELLGID
jgi:hypothetical protein